MRVLLLALIALLGSGPVFAETGSAAADTWYVRPVAECAHNGDGLAYNCAAEAAASGAFKSFSGVIMTTTVGVDDGDTLIACGEFTAADFDTTVYMLFTGFSGANEAGRIKATGDCSAHRTNPSTWTDRAGTTHSGAILDGENSLSYAVGTGTQNFITFENFHLKKFTTASVFSTCVPASNPNSMRYRNLLIEGSVNQGMSFASTNYLVENVTIRGAGNDGIFICAGASGATTGTLRNVEALDVAQTNDDGDSIQQEDGAGALTAIGITGSTRSNSKSCFIFGSEAGTIRVDDWTCLASGANGLVIDGSGAGGYARRGYSAAEAAHVFIRADTMPLAGAFDVASTIGAGGTQGLLLRGAHAAGVLTVANNSFSGCDDAVTMNTAFDPLSAHFVNNALNCDDAIVLSTGGTDGTDLTLTTNRYGPLSSRWVWGAETDTTLAEFQTTSGEDTGSTFGSIDWISGGSISTAGDARIPSDSPLCNAGTYIPGARDYDDLPIYRDIGAFRCPGAGSPQNIRSGLTNGLYSWLLAGLGALLGGAMLMRPRLA